MNKFRIARAGIDVNAALTRMCGDVEMFEKLLLDFLDDTNYQQMMEAIQNKDAKQAFLAAHALKGMVGTLSMTKLYDAICPAVEVFRNNEIDVEEYLPDIEAAYVKVMDAIIDMKNSKEVQ